MMGGLLVLAEGALSKAAVEVASATRPGEDVAVLSESCREQNVLGVPVLGGFACATDCAGSYESAAVAIADGALRLHWMNRLQCMGYALAALVHPLCSVSVHAVIGEGAFVHLGSTVGAGTVVGRGCMLCAGCVVAQDCRVRDGANVCCGAHIENGCDIGYRACVGAGSVVAAGVRIGDDAVVCPGSVVEKDVADGMIVAGAPACVTGNAAFDWKR